ncbi:MAG: hypothetical protein K8R46_09185 [Pirellulales bacterium]|nr:hypothetical protein [Pirellulales bacterium]
MAQNGQSEPSDSMGNCLVRLSLEGNRQACKGNHPKIDFILKKVLALLTPGMKTAEFGIGDGYLMQRLHEAKMQYTGLDISSYLVKYHSKTPCTWGYLLFHC